MCLRGTSDDLIAAGVQVLQLRDKKLDDRTLLSAARLLRRVIDDAASSLNPEPRTLNPLFIMNDRPDLAVLRPRRRRPRRPGRTDRPRRPPDRRPESARRRLDPHYRPSPPGRAGRRRLPRRRPRFAPAPSTSITSPASTSSAKSPPKSALPGPSPSAAFHARTCCQSSPPAFSRVAVGAAISTVDDVENLVGQFLSTLQKFR